MLQKCDTDCRAGLLAMFCLSHSICCIAHSNLSPYTLLFVFLIYYKRKILCTEFTKTKAKNILGPHPYWGTSGKKWTGLGSPLMRRRSHGEVADIQEALQVNLRSENQTLQVNMGFCVPPRQHWQLLFSLF